MIVICGPTATGKTALGVEVAKRLNGEIVSADSMQIYKYMNIGTAKPTEDEKKGIRHHLMDIVDPSETYSVAEYQKDALKAIEEIKSKGKVPIIVGGTGLYINSLIYQYNPSEKSDELRRELTKEYEEFGSEYIYNKLKEVDEESAKVIHPNNVKRVMRALEVKLLTGESIVNKNDKNSSVPCLTYVCSSEREDLYEKINKRVDEMFRQGLVEEVDGLTKKGITFDHQCMQAIGYKEFKEYFERNEDLEIVKDKIKQHTRNYAKRQITWFKHYEDAIWLKNEEIEQKADRIVLEYYKYFCKL